MIGEFVARMEDVLDLYHQDYDPDHPVVCFDETSRQLVADKRPAIGAKPGRVERYDYEYKRNGTRNLFMFCEPKAGWRHVEATEQRTAVDFAHQMRWLVDEAYPHTETIRLVLDNLNTHKLGSLYDAFKPAEARRIAKRLELHYTPVHGSWLNMAEIELSVFSNQCLNRRISDEVVLKREVSALEHERNQAAAVINWRFSTQDARTKLQHTYPSYSDGNGTSAMTAANAKSIHLNRLTSSLPDSFLSTVFLLPIFYFYVRFRILDVLLLTTSGQLYTSTHTACQPSVGKQCTSLASFPPLTQICVWAYCRDAKTLARSVTWSTMSTPTLSLQAASSCLVIGPGTSSPTSLLSALPTGNRQYGVLHRNASSAV